MQIINRVDLTPLNTFRLAAVANYYCAATQEEDLFEIVKEAKRFNLSIFPLGGGSNVIFTQDYAGLILHMNNKGISIVEKHADFVIVEAAAGEVWGDFVNWTLSNDLNGLENLSLIPGAVGAAPVQNIGAYGVEVKDTIVSVDCFDLENSEFVSFNNEQMKFSYRDSIFKNERKGRFVITSVRFRLSKKFVPILDYGPLRALEPLYNSGRLTAKQVAQVVCEIRKEKLPDPYELGNAGSFFKNPVLEKAEAQLLLEKYPNAVHYPSSDKVKFAAGWLIDHAGLKGFQIGGAAVHEKQALVLVNQKNASIQDLLSLVSFIKKEVFKKYGIELEAEPVFI